MNSLRVVGVSHRTAPVAWREKLAVPEERLPDLFSALTNSLGTKETVVLSTCNRVEVYTVTPSDVDIAASVRCALHATHGDSDLNDAYYSLRDAAAIHHLFRVAAGLDSLVIGESEILGQIKRAYDVARSFARTDKLTNVLFQRAVHVGKTVRRATKISEGPTSVASLAVSLSERIFGDLSRSRVLVVGAGVMAATAARAFRAQKVLDLMVCNRTAEKAHALAKECAGRVVPFEEREAALADADIVLCSTGAPTPVFTENVVRRLMERGRDRSLFFIDIAVPRDVEPAVNELDNVYVYNIDDLEALVADSLSRRGSELEKAATLVKNKSDEFTPWYRAWASGQTAALKHADRWALGGQ